MWLYASVRVRVCLHLWVCFSPLCLANKSTWYSSKVVKVRFKRWQSSYYTTSQWNFFPKILMNFCLVVVVLSLSLAPLLLSPLMELTSATIHVTELRSGKNQKWRSCAPRYFDHGLSKLLITTCTWWHFQGYGFKGQGHAVKSCENSSWRDFNRNLNKYFLHLGYKLITFQRSCIERQRSETFYKKNTFLAKAYRSTI